MAAALAELEITGSIAGLKCPITGITVIDAENGFDPDAEHSPHLRFFVDWVDNVWVVDPADLPADQSPYQRALLKIFATGDSPAALIAQCAQVMPKSALVFEILDPPAGSFSGEICWVGFDLGEPATTSRVRLREVNRPENSGKSVR